MSLTRRWSRPVPARALGTARIAVGFAALVKLFVVAPVLLVLALPDALRLPWVPGFAPALAAPLAVIPLWAGASLAFAAGLRTRTAGAILVVLAVLTLATDRQLYSNHLWLLVLLVALLCTADAGAARAIDVRGTGPRTVRTLGPDLIRILVTSVYVWAALWKINAQFLSGWMISISMSGGLLALPAPLRRPEVFAWIAAMTVVTELFVGIALWNRGLRTLAAAGGIVMHVAFVAFIALWAELVVFGLLMLGCYPLFFTPDEAGTAT